MKLLSLGAIRIGIINTGFLLLSCNPVLADTHYVDVNNPTPSTPYTSWATAANSIQEAVDAAADGDTVLVSDGVYDVGGTVACYAGFSRVCITNAITVKSENGPEYTFIVGSEATGGGNGPDAVRGVYMSAGTLSGFTVTNGHTREHASSTYALSGGGIHMYGGSGTASNCVISGNFAYWGGGGSYGGILYDCIISGNWVRRYGGGSRSGKLYYCTLSGNRASDGGGSSESILYNCMLLDNVGRIYGGGSYYCTLYDSTLSGNLARHGGGSYGGKLDNCTLTGNRATAAYGGGSNRAELYNCMLSGNSAYSSGGGSYRSALYNCTLSGNSASSGGGGSYGDRLYNCTVSGNSAGRNGGGMMRGRIYNTIVWNNTPNDIVTGLSIYNSCSPDLTPGVNGNINSDPLIIDPIGGDFRLMATSPCIDAGTNAFVLSTVDLAGSPRIVDGNFDRYPVVDMGAYEFQVEMVPAESLRIPPINPLSKGRTPVVIMSTEDFDAATIDPSSIRFEGAEPVRYSLKGCASDGDIDLKLYFMTIDLDIDSVDGEVMLIGQTYSGVMVVGIDIVKVVPGK